MSGPSRGVDPRRGALTGEAAGQVRKDDGGYPAPRRVDDRRHSPAPGGASPTYYDQPAIKGPVWIWSVPAYFYLGGVAAGAALIGAITRLADGDGYAETVRRSRLLAAGGTALGTAALILDLGRPGRFLNMLRVFRPTSAMSIGSWALAASTTSAWASVVLPRLGAPALGDVAGTAAGALAPALGTYTAVLLADTAVPVWQHTRRELPPLFAASALASATDVLLLTGPDAGEERLTRRLGIAAKVAELAASTAFQRAADAHPRVGRPLHDGASGQLWRGAKVLTATSLAASLVPVPVGWRAARRVMAATLGTLGAIATRFAVFHAGKVSARDPRATFEPQRASMSTDASTTTTG